MRLVSIAWLLALCACATEAASRAEVTDLRAQVQALRDENARLASRVARVEVQVAVSAPGRPERTPLPASSGVEPLPSLTVVKLKPRGPAPSVDLRTQVVEPSPEVLSDLSEGPAASRRDEEEQDPALTDAQFEQGLDALKTGNVQGGVEQLLRLADENPRHPKADNALYFAGVGLMGLDSHAEAAATFERLVSKYPAGDAVVDALLKLGECRARLQQPAEARAAYRRLLSQFPGSPAAAQAQLKLAALSGAALAGKSVGSGH